MEPKKVYRCIVCGTELQAVKMGIMCETCKKDKHAQDNRPYTKDTAYLIRKYYKEYRDKGLSHKKAIKKIAEVLARSEKNVMIAFLEKRCEL